MNADWRGQVLAWAWVYGALPLAWASVILHSLTPWRRTELGRHLLTYSVLIAIILSFSAVRHFHEGALPGAVEWFRFVIYLAFPPVMAWRVAIQVKAARRRD